MGSLIDEFEKKYWSDHKLVCGIDEAGRGPMAGPLIVCGVVFPIGFDHPDINDSKTLSESRRNALASLIYEQALRYEVVEVDVETIDRKNIYRATQDAMAYIATKLHADITLTDAMPLPNVEGHNVVDVIKGDQRSLSIAAASILAKTIRDAKMKQLAQVYPEYGFDQHKGYGTKKHREAIERYGRTPHHRKTFRFKDEDQLKLDV